MYEIGIDDDKMEEQLAGVKRRGPEDTKMDCK
jgi:hypothetical protein